MLSTLRAKLHEAREKKKEKRRSRFIDQQIQSDINHKKSETKCILCGMWKN
jgi:hypothetical protein